MEDADYDRLKRSVALSDLGMWIIFASILMSYTLVGCGLIHAAPMVIIVMGGIVFLVFGVGVVVSSIGCFGITGTLLKQRRNANKQV